MTSRALEDGVPGGCQATPRSPARRKTQPAPPPQPPPPPPPPAAGEELPWGDLSLNKCLALASLVALLGWALQLGRGAVTWEAGAPAPVPEPWAPPSSGPQEPVRPQPKPEARAAPSERPAPPAEAEAKERAEAPGDKAAEDTDPDRGALGGDAGEQPAPRAPKERPGRERPREERRPRAEKAWEARPRREKRREPREPRAAPPRRRAEAPGGGGRGPGARVPGEAKPRQRPAWASARLSEEEEEDRPPPGRQRRRPGRGGD